MPRKKIEPVKIPVLPSVTDESIGLVKNIPDSEHKTDFNNFVNQNEEKGKNESLVNAENNREEKETLNLRESADENSKPTSIYNVVNVPEHNITKSLIIKFPEIGEVKIKNIVESKVLPESLTIDVQNIKIISEHDLKLLIYLSKKLLEKKVRLIFINSEGINPVLNLTDIKFDRE